MLYFPIGNLAKTPYFIKSLGIRVYCYEEIAYVIAENVLRLEEDFMDYELISFISRDLGLEELSGPLTEALRADDLSRFCSKIVSFGGMYSADKVKAIAEVLKENQALSNGMRHFKRADFYFRQNAYALSIAEYKIAATYLDRDGDNEKLSECLYNMGSAYARLFEYEKATKAFLESYELSNDEDSYTRYLACLRLGKTKDEYLLKIEDAGIDALKVQQLEDWISVLLTDSDNSDFAAAFKDALRINTGGEVVEYYGALEKILSDIKSECRRNLALEII